MQYAGAVFYVFRTFNQPTDQHEEGSNGTVRGHETPRAETPSYHNDADSEYGSDTPPPLMTDSEFSDDAEFITAYNTESITTDEDGDPYHRALDDVEAHPEYLIPDLGTDGLYDELYDEDIAATVAPTHGPVPTPTEAIGTPALRGDDPDNYRVWLTLLEYVLQEFLNDTDEYLNEGTVQPSHNLWGDDL